MPSKKKFFCLWKIRQKFFFFLYLTVTFNGISRFAIFDAVWRKIMFSVESWETKQLYHAQIHGSGFTFRYLDLNVVKNWRCWPILKILIFGTVTCSELHGNCVCQDFACFWTSFEMICMGTNVFQGLYKVWKEKLSRVACFWDLRVRFFASAKWPFWLFCLFSQWETVFVKILHVSGLRLRWFVWEQMFSRAYIRCGKRNCRV